MGLRVRGLAVGSSQLPWAQDQLAASPEPVKGLVGLVRDRCLLKGCEQPFRPTHPQARYCSRECRAAVRRWRRRRASRQYRQTPDGQAKRQAQSRQYRCRCAGRRQVANIPTGSFGDAESTVHVSTAIPRGSAPASQIELFLLRAPGLRSALHTDQSQPLPTVLQPFLSSGFAASHRTRTSLAPARTTSIATAVHRQAITRALS